MSINVMRRYDAMIDNFEDQKNILFLKNIIFEIFQAGFVSAVNGEDLKTGYEKYFEQCYNEYLNNN